MFSVFVVRFDIVRVNEKSEPLKKAHLNVTLACYDSNVTFVTDVP